MEIDFQYLVRQVALLFEVVQNEVEELPLELKIQPARGIEAHQPSVQANIGILARGPRLVAGPAKVDAIIRDESPVAVEDHLLEFPILAPRFSQVVYVGAEKAARMSQRLELGT
jgi:hypothetical protein